MRLSLSRSKSDSKLRHGSPAWKGRTGKVLNLQNFVVVLLEVDVKSIESQWTRASQIKTTRTEGGSVGGHVGDPFDSY